MLFSGKSLLGKVSAAVLVLTMATACAETPQENAIKQNLLKNMGGNSTIDKVVKTPVKGLYEVQTAGQIFYTDSTGSYLIAGQIFDAKTRKNLTRERADELMAFKFNDLPLDLAVKRVNGNGERAIAVFSDPNCSYCKKLEQNLENLNNVTIYSFVYPFLSANSKEKARNIWCASDKVEAWKKTMIKGESVPAAPAGCKDVSPQVLDLGRRLNIRGTPTILFTDGTRSVGAWDVKAFEDKFNSMNKK